MESSPSKTFALSLCFNELPGIHAIAAAWEEVIKYQGKK